MLNGYVKRELVEMRTPGVSADCGLWCSTMYPPAANPDMNSGSNNQGSRDHNGHPSASWTDGELVRHLQNHHDERAFAELCQRHAAFVLQRAGKGLNPFDAQDIAQEVLIYLWKRIPSLRHHNVPRLLAKATRNCVITFRRKHKRRVLWDPCDFDLLPMNTTNGQKSGGENWDEAWAILSQEEFLLLELKYEKGLTFQEIARNQRLTVGQATRRFYEVLKRLRKSESFSKNPTDLCA